MRYINLCTVDNSFEANFIKDNLGEERIKCILTNENFTSLMPHMNGMLGAGIQILVDKDDLVRATEILGNRNDRDVTVCPDCNSSNVEYGLGTKHRLKKLLALSIALLIGSPVRFIGQTYYCRDCKT